MSYVLNGQQRFATDRKLSYKQSELLVLLQAHSIFTLDGMTSGSSGNAPYESCSVLSNRSMDVSFKTQYVLIITFLFPRKLLRRDQFMFISIIFLYSKSLQAIHSLHYIQVYKSR